MPNTGKRAEPPTDEEKARIVPGPDLERFYCPQPGCNRSFAELWRLKVHFRAPPDVRGSGKERGHGTELKFCPKCGKDLRPGKHHVGCSAGKSAPRQAAKRQRQQMSTTTESAQGPSAATTTEHTSSSWEQAVRRQAVKQRQTSEGELTQHSRKAEACRIEMLVQNLDAHHAGDLLFHSNVPNGGVHVASSEATMASQHYHQQPVGSMPMPPVPGAPQQQAPAQHPMQQAQVGAAGGSQQPAQLLHLDLPQQGDGGQLHSHSPSPLDLFGDTFGASDGHGSSGSHHDPFGHDDDLRIPSPPPLPADWDVGPRACMLFDFDQFDVTKRQQTGTLAPLVTVTTAMNPVDVLNPSDDYIWQILFAGENDAVPKRVTAHLHHPPTTALSYLEADPLLDAILSDDLGPLLHDVPLAQQPPQQQQAPSPPPQQQQGHGQPGGMLDPSAERLVPVGSDPYQHQHQQHVHLSLGAVFQQHQPQRNDFSSHAPGDMAHPAVKLKGSSFL